MYGLGSFRRAQIWRRKRVHDPKRFRKLFLASGFNGHCHQSPFRLPPPTLSWVQKTVTDIITMIKPCTENIAHPFPLHRASCTHCYPVHTLSTKLLCRLHSNHTPTVSVVPRLSSLTKKKKKKIPEFFFFDSEMTTRCMDTLHFVDKITEKKKKNQYFQHYQLEPSANQVAHRLEIRNHSN